MSARINKTEPGAILTVVAAVLAALAGVAANLSALKDWGDRAHRSGRDVEILEARKQQAALVAQIERLSEQNRVLVLQLKSTGRSGAPASNEAALEARVARLELGQTRIGDAILVTPERALELPMLKRDLQEVRAANAESVSAMRREIDRVYDLNKWLFGGLAVSIFSLAVTNFLRPAPKG